MAFVPGVQHERNSHAVAGMRSLHLTAQAQLYLVRAHHNLNWRTLREGQRHFQIASSGTQVAQMAVVPHRASPLVHFRSQTARIPRLSAAVVRLAAEPCSSLSAEAAYLLLLALRRFSLCGHL